MLHIPQQSTALNKSISVAMETMARKHLIQCRRMMMTSAGSGENKGNIKETWNISKNVVGLDIYQTATEKVTIGTFRTEKISF